MEQTKYTFTAEGLMAIEQFLELVDSLTQIKESSPDRFVTDVVGQVMAVHNVFCEADFDDVTDVPPHYITGALYHEAFIRTLASRISDWLAYFQSINATEITVAPTDEVGKFEVIGHAA
jgi:hypothetical protein